MTNWSTIKMHYELLGDSLQDLARDHNVSVRLIETAIENENWVRRPIAKDVTSWAEGENYDDEEILANVKKKSGLMGMIRNAHMAPDLFRLETLLISKLNSVISNLNDDNEDAASQIKTLVECVKMLNPVPKQTMAEATEGNGGITIQILSQYGHDGSDPQAQVAYNVQQPVAIGVGD